MKILCHCHLALLHTTLLIMPENYTWFDPRLTVFIIWGTFILLFICIPFKRYIQLFFHRLGFPCCRYVVEDENIVGRGLNNENGGGIIYELLSSSRKREIDSLRASHITYRMHPFTLTLGKQHFLTSHSNIDVESSTIPSLTMASSSSSSTNIASPQDRDPADAETNDSVTAHNDDTVNNVATDEETGIVRVVDPPELEGGDEEENKEEDKNEEEGKYTHISLPLAGYNFGCVQLYNDDVEKEMKPSEIEVEKEKKLISSMLRLFVGKGKSAKEVDVIDEPMKEVELSIPPVASKMIRRNCHIYCAICLAEYEPNERVSWSSNQDCTHTFHEDCVVEWLVSLGRTKSKNQRFTDEPTEAQLLNYQLDCPCCRQAFISTKAIDV